MTLINAFYATFEISKEMVPPIFIGFFLASFIHSSGYFNRLCLPTAYLAYFSNLPSNCTGALTLFLVNNWASLSMLSEEHRAGRLSDRELIVSILVGSIPKGLNNAILYTVPVAISVLGLQTGAIYVFFEAAANFFVASVGIVLGKLILESEHLELFVGNTHESPRWWKRIEPSLRECISSSKKIIKTLIPTIFLAQLAINYILLLPIVEKYNSLIQPFGFPSSSLIVLLASVVSQSAALVASGTLLDNSSISPKHCLILMFMARCLHRGIGFMRIGIPAYVSYFGGSLGIRVATIEYFLIEVANVLVILLICLLL
jgi:hypothetical protein